MKKNRIITMSLREIKKSRKRFFSLCILSVIGVSFFVGMKISGPTMLASLDKYYDSNNIYDLKVISTLGLEDEDIKEIQKLNSKYQVLGSHTKDAIFNDGKHEAVLRIHELNEGMNNIMLLKGRMPQKYNEIVVEDGFTEKTDYKIGDKIKLELEEDDTTIKTDEVEIVGVVMSPEYLNNSLVTQSRGNTTIGNGQVAYYSYALKDLYSFDYYTEIYVVDPDATKYTTAKDDYLKKIEKDEKIIATIKETRQKERYLKLVAEATKKIKEEEDKATAEFNKAKEQLDKVKEELDKGKAQLDSSKRELDNADYQIQQGYKQVKRTREELERGDQKLKAAKKEVEGKLTNNVTYDKLVIFVQKYDSSAFSVNDIITLFSDNNVDVNGILNNSSVNIKAVASSYGINLETLFNRYGINAHGLLSKPDIKLDEVLDVTTISQLKQLITDDDFIVLVKESIPPTTANYNEIENYLSEFSRNKNNIVKLFYGVREIENGRAEYNRTVQTVNENEVRLNQAKIQYQDGFAKYNVGMNEYSTNLETYEKNYKEYDKNKTKTEEKIALAKEKIKKMEDAIWYIQTREDNNEYITYVSSYTSVDNLSSLFPIIFFLVAVMMSLLSMARMAIENRSEIGTLKALGFNNNEVRLKFVIYSLLATLIGGVIGVIGGYTVFPTVIIGVFKIMHNIPEMVYSTDITPVIVGLLISIACIVGSTIITINNLVKEKTTSLLRPIAPPIGKKILLEKIPFIWNRLKYSTKLTYRNIFRYKRRMYMAIFGIASCTMILLSGYGIKDAIAYVVDKQYNEINHNDVLISLDNKATKEELDKFIDDSQLDFNVYARIDQIKVENKRLSFIIPYDKKEFRKALTLRDAKTKKELKLKDNSVIVTEKLAKYFNKKVGDTITILESNNITYDFKISGICENYIGDYIYISKRTYERYINEYKINTQYLKFKDLNKEDEIMSYLTNNNHHILSTVSISNAKKEVDTLFKSLNLIVYVLVVFSGALSFVVFYSLAYINLSERQREIATLKVLGYYNKEVDNYIMKEELIITIIGILVGLVAGTIYSYLLIDSIEINTMQYIKGIHLDSYIQTSVFMIMYTIIVSVVVHFALKKIDLIESLKSVE